MEIERAANFVDDDQLLILQRDLKKLEKDIKSEQQQLESFFKKKKQLKNVKKMMFKALLKINEQKKLDEHLLKQYLLNRIFAQILENTLKEKAETLQKEYDLSLIIDEKMIQKVLEEEQRNRKEAEEAAANAAANFKERAKVNI